MKRLFTVLFTLILFTGCQNAQQSPTLNTDQLITDIQILSADDMEGRLVGSKGNAKAREYILNRFEEIGLTPFEGDYIHEFSVERNSEEIPAYNLIGMVKGESDSAIVITAHYDHVGMRDSLIFNGADDNASGTAGLIALADYFNQTQPKHTLVFAALDAEEGGLNGAVAFTEDSAYLEKVVLNVNMDMISQNSQNEIYAVGTYHYPWLKPILETVDTGELTMSFGHDRPEDGLQDWTYASDHGPFHMKGIPFVYFGVEDHEHYHQPSDEFLTIPQDFYKKSVKLIANSISILDQSNLSQQ